MLPLLLAACAPGIALIRPDDTDTDTGPHVDAIDTSDPDTSADSGDSSADTDTAPISPTITGIALTCDGLDVRAWWQIDGDAGDVGVTWYTDQITYSIHASIDGVDGSIACGAATVPAIDCAELGEVTLRIEAIDVAGAGADCAELGLEAGATCRPLLTPPDCE